MADNILSAPYILHHVLLQLPQQDLLIVQRVCRTWHEAISSSKVLQAALFLHPKPTKSSDESVEINPLLRSRFPSFFDIDLAGGPLHSGDHGIGPWFSTHWAENIHPWPSHLDRLRWGPVRPIESPKLDPHRSEAYKHPKASWRRMIPCMPPPIELQVNYEYRPSAREKSCTLRCLKFDNEIRSDKGESALIDAVHRMEQQPWLTFGLLYDIVEAAWFQNIPTPVSSARFDYSFQEERPYLYRASTQAGEPLSWPTPQEKLAMFRYGRREQLRDALPQKPIGGTRRILVLLTGSERGKSREKRYKGEFRVNDGAMQQLKWDEEIEWTLN